MLDKLHDEGREGEPQSGHFHVCSCTYLIFAETVNKVVCVRLSRIYTPAVLAGLALTCPHPALRLSFLLPGFVRLRLLLRPRYNPLTLDQHGQGGTAG